MAAHRPLSGSVRTRSVPGERADYGTKARAFHFPIRAAGQSGPSIVAGRGNRCDPVSAERQKYRRMQSAAGCRHQKHEAYAPRKQVPPAQNAVLRKPPETASPAPEIRSGACLRKVSSGSGKGYRRGLIFSLTGRIIFSGLSTSSSSSRVRIPCSSTSS